MGVELFPAFVGVVDGVKKRHRVGHMHQHGQIELPSHGPQRVEACIVDGDQCAVLVADMQPKGLPDFETTGATGDLRLQALRCPKAEFIAMAWPFRPIDPCKDAKAIGGRVHKMCQMLVKNVFAPATIEVDERAHVGTVEHVEQFGQRLFVPATTKGTAEVVVRIDDGEAWLRNRGLLGDQLGTWLEFVELHGYLSVSMGRSETA